MNYSPPASSVHGILQARRLQWVAMPSSRGSSNPWIEPVSPVAPTLQADSLPLSHEGSPCKMYIYIGKGLSFQFSSVTQSCLTLCDPMNRSMPGFPVHHQLPEPTQIHVHHVSDAIQPFHPLSSPSPPAFNLSLHQDPFQWVSSWIRWPKYWSFSFNITPSNEYSGLISFRMDWLSVFSNTTVQNSHFFST